ncbi:hypothetical protein [Sediminitomix flava]|uniref:Zinc ribbon protein n=1 Tax=Sediminitomix flava TaxID=379075 RepID=A0A315ZDV4_SEDFL|nr:hypothetical protein [Sediminitomix flava]PWJ42934.1 hypothetical protein BC781_102481 [Sediminitomix flava]
MNNCQNCTAQIAEDLQICNTCGFPLGGSKQEQAAFRAKQIIQKSKVKQSLKNLIAARIILIIWGVFYILAAFIPSFGIQSNAEIGISVVLGLIFIASSFLATKKPKIALIIPLSILIISYLLVLFISPIALFNGILWKALILMVLFYAYFRVRNAEKILAENPYLRTQLDTNR